MGKFRESILQGLESPGRLVGPCGTTESRALTQNNADVRVFPQSLKSCYDTRVGSEGLFRKL
jgi:hypothetical protein